MKVKTEIITTFEKFKQNGGFALIIAREENIHDFPEMEISWFISKLPDEVAIVWLNLIQKELRESLWRSGKPKGCDEA